MILAALAINWVFRQTTTTLYETAALWQSLGGIVLGIFILAVSTRYLGNTGMFIAVVVAMLVHLPALVVLYYFKPADERITFVIIGNIGLGVTLIVSYFIAIINKIRGVSAPEKKVEGLTLWTIDRSKIK